MPLLGWGAGEVEVRYSVGGYDAANRACSTESGERVVRKTFADTVEVPIGSHRNDIHFRSRSYKKTG